MSAVRLSGWHSLHLPGSGRPGSSSASGWTPMLNRRLSIVRLSSTVNFTGSGGTPVPCIGILCQAAAGNRHGQSL